MVASEKEVKVKLEYWEDKMKIMQGSDISIDDDLKEREEKIERWLRIILAREETKRGKTGNARYKRLRLERSEWQWKEKTRTLKKKKWRD